jgi:DNA-binding transcriptional LysR family regulator
MDLVALQIFRRWPRRAASPGRRAPAPRSRTSPPREAARRRASARSFSTAGAGASRLSAEGRTLLAYAERLLALSAEARAALRSGTPRGVLRIGSLESTAATRLPPVLSRYHLAYPEVRLELVTGTSGALVGKVLSGDVEAAFVAEPFTAQGLATQAAFSEELVLIAPKGCAAIRGAKDAAHLPVLAFAAGCSYRLRLESWLGRADVSPSACMEYGSYHAIVACVAAAAASLVPRSMSPRAAPGREVRIHRLPKEIAASTTRLVWRQGTARRRWTRSGTLLAEAPPDPLRGRGRSRNGAPRPAQRVHHGVHQRGQRAGDAGLAHALRAERIELRGHRLLQQLQVGHQPGARHRVVHEAPGEELTALAVVHRSSLRTYPRPASARPVPVPRQSGG